MAAERAGRRSDQVHDVLRRDILEGRLAPGDAVPSERTLVERLGVNRHAVREALKRLEQAGLVRISHGGATRVRDWRDTAGLEVLLDLAGGDAEGPPPAELSRSIIEMRASVGIDAARRCAARAGEATRAEIRALARASADAVGGGAEVLEDRYGALWQAIVVGSENVAYRLAFNSLQQALASYRDLADAVRPTDGGAVAELGDAIAHAEPERAAAAAAALLDQQA